MQAPNNFNQCQQDILKNQFMPFLNREDSNSLYGVNRASKKLVDESIAQVTYIHFSQYLTFLGRYFSGKNLTTINSFYTSLQEFEEARKIKQLKTFTDQRYEKIKRFLISCPKKKLSPILNESNSYNPYIGKKIQNAVKDRNECVHTMNTNQHIGQYCDILTVYDIINLRKAVGRACVSNDLERIHLYVSEVDKFQHRTLTRYKTLNYFQSTVIKNMFRKIKKTLLVVAIKHLLKKPSGVSDINKILIPYNVRDIKDVIRHVTIQLLQNKKPTEAMDVILTLYPTGSEKTTYQFGVFNDRFDLCKLVVNYHLTNKNYDAIYPIINFLDSSHKKNMTTYVAEVLIDKNVDLSLIFKLDFLYYCDLEVFDKPVIKALDAEEYSLVFDYACSLASKKKARRTRVLDKIFKRLVDLDKISCVFTLLDKVKDRYESESNKNEKKSMLNNFRVSIDRFYHALKVKKLNPPKEFYDRLKNIPPKKRLEYGSFEDDIDQSPAKRKR